MNQKKTYFHAEVSLCIITLLAPKKQTNAFVIIQSNDAAEEGSAGSPSPVKLRALRPSTSGASTSTKGTSTSTKGTSKRKSSYRKSIASMSVKLQGMATYPSRSGN